jgi:hypothetical protein
MLFQSSAEVIARSIAQAFPAANLDVVGRGEQVAYEISLNAKVLVRIDRLGAVFNLPTRCSTCVISSARNVTSINS